LLVNNSEYPISQRLTSIEQGISNDEGKQGKRKKRTLFFDVEKIFQETPSELNFSYYK